MSAVLDNHGHAAGHDDHHHHQPTGWRRWVYATNHKDIGTLYLLFSFTMLMIGGVLAMLIRAELFQPGLQLVNPELFNQLTTMHGLIMVFGAIMPAFVGFANWMLPLQIGASDMAFARMNNFSFWLMIPAASVDRVIADIAPLLDAGDILVDGGNSHFPDTIRRCQYVESKGLLYVGTGDAAHGTNPQNLKSLGGKVLRVRADGSPFWCEMTGRALDPEHPDNGSIWMLADVTERIERRSRVSRTAYLHMMTVLVIFDVHIFQKNISAMCKSDI